MSRGRSDYLALAAAEDAAAEEAATEEAATEEAASEEAATEEAASEETAAEDASAEEDAASLPLQPTKAAAMIPAIARALRTFAMCFPSCLSYDGLKSDEKYRTSAQNGRVFDKKVDYFADFFPKKREANASLFVIINDKSSGYAHSSAHPR